MFALHNIQIGDVQKKHQELYATYRNVQ